MTELALTARAALFGDGFNCRIKGFYGRITRKLSSRISKAISSNSFRFSVIAVMFLSLILARVAVHSFGVSLGYLYLIVISLAGIWFGSVGGLFAAAASVLIFSAEIIIFRDWPFRDLVLNGASFRLLAFSLGGIIVGYISEMEKRLKERLKELAYKDELTGCVNYRWTMQILENEIERSERYQKETSIIIIDIDHFKDINDTYGHQAGNDILKAFVDALKNNIRAIDTVGRYGGEEFIIIFPEKNPEEALVAVDRIRERLSGLHMAGRHFKHGLDIRLTFSAGVASFPSNGKNLDVLIDAADKALYRAKNDGRNRTTIEKRRWMRFDPARNIRVEILEPSGKDRLQPLKIKDISQKGMLLIFPNDIPAGELLLKVRFPEEEVISEFKCKVVHKKNEKGLCYVGVNFIDIPVEVENKIANYGASP
ncbi:MAG: diguanylate cyclase [Candidatus Omnitrophica bacterium]|nr:diguanylate cyclase [Candidatus Omnitrophota bacterium]MDD5546464.1 diguanylate cyclase [Candidatus Omnitrophota bacterium]